MSDENQSLNLDAKTDLVYIKENARIGEQISNYASLLETIESVDGSVQNLTEKDALLLLLARDELQNLLNQNPEIPPNQVLSMVDLDDRLYRNRGRLLKLINLEQSRKVLRTPDQNWWWFMQPKEEIDSWDQVDWLWNLLSLGFLAGFVALASQIIPIIFSDGFSIFESVGLLGPGALLTLIGSNIKGGNNRDKFIKTLSGIGVPAKYCSEVTCLIAALLFTGAYAARQILPTHYFNQLVTDGKDLYKNSRLVLSREKFESTLKLPDMEPQKLGEVYNYLGLIEESVGNDKQAIEDYERSILLKNLSSINNISRVYIAKGDLLAAESYLKIGLQRIRQDENTTDHLLDYQLHRNLGWAYVEGKRYKEAEVELKAARKISSQHLNNREYLGKAMGSCFLGHVYEQTDRAAEAEPLWARCRNSGRPETIDEYRAIVKFKPEIAQYIDTTGIF